jgi:large conductance mechanosensitive channel
MKGFLKFVRDHGVAGLAIGFALGQAASNLVTSFVNSIVNPAVGLLTGGTINNLASSSVMVGNASIAYGQFLSVVINTAIILFVVYAAAKILRLEQAKKDEDKK